VINVRITVTETRSAARLASGDHPAAYAEWSGEIDWPTVPRPGVDNWAHCGDWAAEQIHQTYFHGPPLIGGDPFSEPGVTVEVETTADVIVHLIAEHGFMGGQA
jgi:hypothetical protein